MKFRLVESLTSDLEKIVKDHFIISSYPVSGASFILSDGSFVDLSESFNNNSFEDFPCHGEVDDYLFSIGVIEKPGDYSDGSPSIQNVGAIRINDVEEDNNYIELSPVKPTLSQLNALEAWLDMNLHNQIALCTPGMKQHVIYNLDDVDYIIKRIKRYYASGQLYEGAHKMRFKLAEDWSRTDIDKIIKDEFAQDYPGEGCIYIAPDGSFIDIYPKLDDHEDLIYWLEEQGVDESEVVEDAEWLTDTFNYIRCRNSIHLCFVALPESITDVQIRSLLEWLETRVSSDSLQIIAGNDYKIYDLDDYFPEDIIKIIKRYYSSGKLYEGKEC